MRANRGALLVLVLFLLGILLALGLGFMSSRASRYRASAHRLETAQAESLAMAGLEDARVKLNRDLAFAPGGAEGQKTFSYSEDVTDFDNQLVGSYSVVVDLTYRHDPYYLVVITSTGLVGPRESPISRHTYQAEWSSTDRPGPLLLPSGELGNFRDLGGY